MKFPCCSVCHYRYDDSDHSPLLLTCGHGFCRKCLNQMFSSSPSSSLPCPRCRHVTLIGNSVSSLRKNFPILSLLSSPSSPPSSSSDSDDNTDDYFRQPLPTVTSRCVEIDVSTHAELKLVRRLGEGRRQGHEAWTGVLAKKGACRHRVAVRRVAVTEEMDAAWVQSRLEDLRRASMWCRNVCSFHGAVRMDGFLCLVMDRYNGSVQDELRQNRLTLEQILR